jgi:O-acetyl-ADP-ribose deacetylase (regulator of RNase III)
VIHAVGPVWRGGSHGEPELLASAYRESLRRAADVGARTVAFPAISCGAYGYPVADAAVIAVREVQRFLESDARVEHVTLACFGQTVLDAYRHALSQSGVRSRHPFNDCLPNAD